MIYRPGHINTISHIGKSDMMTQRPGRYDIMCEKHQSALRVPYMCAHDTMTSLPGRGLLL